MAALGLRSARADEGLRRLPYDGSWEELDRGLARAGPRQFVDAKAGIQHPKAGWAQADSLNSLISSVGPIDGQPTSACRSSAC